jgi:hypothetical protein
VAESWEDVTKTGSLIVVGGPMWPFSWRGSKLAPPARQKFISRNEVAWIWAKRMWSMRLQMQNINRRIQEPLRMAQIIFVFRTGRVPPLSCSRQRSRLWINTHVLLRNPNACGLCQAVNLIVRIPINP